LRIGFISWRIAWRIAGTAGVFTILGVFTVQLGVFTAHQRQVLGQAFPWDWSMSFERDAQRMSEAAG
jgi:hypothetical protein